MMLLVMPEPDLIARIERLEALVARLVEGSPDLLSPALARATAGEWFTAGELWRLAVAQDEAAAAIGLPRPELIEALETEGIRSPHGLGRWLAGRDGKGVERGGAERGGVLWRMA